MKVAIILTIVALVALAGVTVGCGKAELSSAELQQKAAEFIQHLSNQEYSAAVEQFDTTMRADLPEEKLKEIWESKIATLGPLKLLGDSKVYQEAGDQIVLQNCDFEKGKLDVKVVFDTEGRIAGLWFLPAFSGEES